MQILNRSVMERLRYRFPSEPLADQITETTRTVNRPLSQIEAQISARKLEVETALQHLMETADSEFLQAVGQANAAFGQFMALTANVMHLSRQNSNVKSLDLSLGSKRKMVSQCEEVLAALQNTVQSRTFRATR